MHLQQNVSLAPFTTLRIGGTARFFATITSEADLLAAVGFASAQHLPTFILGGGSNLVVPDEGFGGLVMHIALPQSIVRRDDPNAVFFNVSAGADWNALVLHICELGISGMECLAGIPGLVGGSPIQNIGAYGQEVSQTVSSVRALDLVSNTFVELAHVDCRFAYRTSIFNSTARNRYVITSVCFKLSPDATPNLSYVDLTPLRNTDASPLAVYHAVRAIRNRKGMLIDTANLTTDSRSAGSFFKNPVVSAASLAHIAGAVPVPLASIPQWPANPGGIKLSAAWLIERAGFPRGFALTTASSVSISSRHTLALINRSGSASCAELLHLRDHIAAEVQRQFQIRLEQEPVTLA